MENTSETKFKFFTYDNDGHDIVINVYGKDANEAWERFDRLYGKDRPVDMMVKAVDI